MSLRVFALYFCVSAMIPMVENELKALFTYIELGGWLLLWEKAVTLTGRGLCSYGVR